MKMVKNTSLLIIITGFVFGGINHFLHPGVYVPIIPRYIPYPIFLNYLSGALEILFAFFVIFKPTRNIGLIGICLLLIAFLPVHIQMVIDAPVRLNTFTVTPLVAWIRLLLQPLLILWAWYHMRPDDATSDSKKHL